MATTDEVVVSLFKAQAVLRDGQDAHAVLRKLCELGFPLFLRSLNDKKTADLDFFLEVTVLDGNRTFVFYKRTSPSTTIRLLKQMVTMRYNVPVTDQLWIFNRRLVHDNEKLENLNLNDVAMLCPAYVILWPYGGAGRRKLPNLVEAGISKGEVANHATWSCKACTTKNHIMTRNCSVCFQPRHPENVAPVDDDSSDEEPYIADIPANHLPMDEKAEVNGNVTLTDLPQELVEKFGWSCPVCTYMNRPTRPGCELCAADRPADYQVPSPAGIQQAMKKPAVQYPYQPVPQVRKKKPEIQMENAEPPIPKQILENGFRGQVWNCEVCESPNSPDANACATCTFERVVDAPEPPPMPARDALDNNQVAMEEIIREALGWKCQPCNRKVSPQSLQCTKCFSPRPADYKLPSEEEERLVVEVAKNMHAGPPSPPIQPPVQQNHVQPRRVPPPAPPRREPKPHSVQTQNEKTVTEVVKGWTCPTCSFINRPRRPGCEICAGEPPEGYNPDEAPEDPEEERKRKQNEMEFLAREEERMQQQYEQLQRMDDDRIIETDQEFECPICITDVEPGEGIRLRSCLHEVCKECLLGTMRNEESGDVRCPECGIPVADRDMKNLAPEDLWLKRLERVEKFTARTMNGVFQCQTMECPIFVEVVDDINDFICDACGARNCLLCKALHERDESCQEYQEKLVLKARNDQEARLTMEMFERLIEEGEALRCPKCKVILQKKDGCDWVRCSVCRMEICWATKGPRWGPGGKGDISGGCRCRIGGKPCTPYCKNCH